MPIPPCWIQASTEMIEESRDNLGLPSHQEDIADQEDVIEQDGLEDAVNWAETQATLLQDAAIQRYEADIEDELTESLKLDPDEAMQDLDAIMFEPISPLQYVTQYEDELDRANLSAYRQSIAGQILTGYTDPSRNTQHKICSFPEGEVEPADLIYSIDIDSVMATFQATDPWPFRPIHDVQIYPVGPYDRRHIGTSKFRMDPSDIPGSNQLDWERRVSKRLKRHSNILRPHRCQSITLQIPYL